MLLTAAALLIQLITAPFTVTGTVRDPTGAPVPGVRITIAGNGTATAQDGTFTVRADRLPGILTISAGGFANRTVEISATTALPLHIVIEPRGITAALTVSAMAERARVSTPAAVTVLDGAALESTPALTLDDQLRSLPGFSLFRRSSSRVANPTTQGVTMRGLAASGASRATVLADNVPLTDPFGGWVYWDRVPAAAVERVEVARGGASDIYGSDAMGGAIRVETASAGVRLLVEGGEKGTARVSAFAGQTVGRGLVRGGAERFTTDGFIVVAPESRGPIDVAADSRHTSLFGAAGIEVASTHVEARGGYFSERRGNGTPFQSNATTGRDLSLGLSGGAAAGFWSARGVFASQDYDQSFSAVNAARDAERPTSTQRVESSSRQLALEYVKPAGAWTIVAGASARQAEADLSERLPPDFSTLPAPPIAALQRSGALSTQVTWTISPRATLAAGARAERWSTKAGTAAAAIRVGSFVPRMSFSLRAAPSVTIRAAIQDAYRVPTMNELYRAFRVGNAQTLANPSLTPEKALGADASMLVARGPAVFRATAFVAQVSDAIVNVTLSSTPALILRRRSNAGRIHARGVEVESELRLRPTWSVTASGTYGSSTFGSGSELDGLRVPQVPRLQLSAGLRGAWTRANAAVDWRYSGRQFDDDRNQFELRAAAITDARASWVPRHGVEVFVAVENLFDVDQDVGRTPLRTIGLPRTARVGFRFRY